MYDGGGTSMRIELKEARLPIKYAHKAWYSHRKPSIDFMMCSQPSEHTERLVRKKLLRLLAEIGNFFPVEGCATLVRPPASTGLLLTGRKDRCIMQSGLLSTFSFPLNCALPSHNTPSIANQQSILPCSLCRLGTFGGIIHHHLALCFKKQTGHRFLCLSHKPPSVLKAFFNTLGSFAK